LYVEVGDVEDLVLVHEGLCVGSWWSVHDDSDDFLLHFDDWVKVCFGRVHRAPYGDAHDEVGEYVHVVELDHVFPGEELRGVPEWLDVGLDFFDGVSDGVVVFEVVLDNEPE